MRRFITPDVVKGALDKPGFGDYLLKENMKVFAAMQQAIVPVPDKKSGTVVEFKM